MTACLAFTPVLWTFVFVLVPTRLVHYMFATDHDIIVFMERGLTKITYLVYLYTIESHVAPGIFRYVLIEENPISNPWDNKLEHKIYNQ